MFHLSLIVNKQAQMCRWSPLSAVFFASCHLEQPFEILINTKVCKYWMYVVGCRRLLLERVFHD
jgi:hypothetical protein